MKNHVGLKLRSLEMKKRCWKKINWVKKRIEEDWWNGRRRTLKRYEGDFMRSIFQGLEQLEARFVAGAVAWRWHCIQISLARPHVSRRKYSQRKFLKFLSSAFRRPTLLATSLSYTSHVGYITLMHHQPFHQGRNRTFPSLVYVV